MCPWCEKELGSFVIKRFPGTVYYQCYRASCPSKRGIIQLDVDLQPHRYEKKSRVKQFNRPTRSIPEDVAIALFEQYELEGHDLELHRVGMSDMAERDSGLGDIIAWHPALHIPIYGAHGQLMAHWLKSWPKAPVKNDMIVVSEQFNGLFVADQIVGAPLEPYVVIVEDPLSAIKAEAHGLSGLLPCWALTFTTI